MTDIFSVTSVERKYMLQALTSGSLLCLRANEFAESTKLKDKEKLCRNSQSTLDVGRASWNQINAIK